MPSGWMRSDLNGRLRIGCAGLSDEVIQALEGFFFGVPEQFLLWLGGRYSHRIAPLQRRFIETELEALQEFGERQPVDPEKRKQLTLL